MKDIEITIDYYTKLNAILAKEQALSVGSLRNKPIWIDCIPEDIPPCTEETVCAEISKLTSINEYNFREIVANVFCRLVRMQPFFDGNKRATNVLCNTVLIQKNLGLFVIPVEKIGEFNHLLRDYYTEKNSAILEFISMELIYTKSQLCEDAIRG
ncbi:MAG: Fic family protein [Desulfovibrio sp.]|nr:Fic family protein [Desulfovibrio sp.]